jgi:hypothetical protein
MLAELSKTTEEDVLITLYDAYRDMVDKIVDPNFSNHWTTKKFKYPGTPLILKLKAKGHCVPKAKKISSIHLSLTLWHGREKAIDTDTLNNIVEKILLRGE